MDLRSDTVTRPTPAMRAAMAAAEVGDDVYGEDPTVNRLQQRAAEIFEREAALFVPTGCMGNLLAIMGWTRPTNEVICELKAHVNLYELASMSAVAGVMPRPVPAPKGILSWELIEAAIREKIYYDSQTALVTLENTQQHARRHRVSDGGGRRYLRKAPRRGIARASGWRAGFQRCRGAGEARRANDPQIRFGNVLPVERLGRAGGVDAGRSAKISSRRRGSAENCWAAECARWAHLQRRD